MPQFYFHLRTAQGVEWDDTGIQFSDLGTAYLDACRAIPALVPELLDRGCDPLRCAFEITDEGGQNLMEVPFAERLTKDVAQIRPAVTSDGDDVATLDRLFLSVAHNLTEAQKLRRSVQTARLRLARTLSSRNKPFLSSIAQAYGVPEAVADGRVSATMQ